MFGIYRIRESGGGKATLLPQVGGLHRRQNSGHPLFSVRVRSRRDSRHMLQTKKRLGALFCLEFIEYGSRGRQGNFVAAGRRSPPTTKQRSSAVFRARPLKARLPSPAPDKKAPFRCSPLILAAAQFKHCAAALCRNNRRQHRIRPQKFHPADKTARFRASRL